MCIRDSLYWYHEHHDKLLTIHLLFQLEDIHHQYNLLHDHTCLLYTSDAADERSSVDLGGRRIIKKKKNIAVGATCADILYMYEVV